MRAAADFEGEIAHLVGAHALTVLVFEQADGALFLGFRHSHFFAYDRDIRCNGFIDELFDFGQLFLGDLAAEGEVKAQALSGNVGTLLGNLGSEDLAQSGMEQVSSGVQAGRFFGLVSQAALELLISALMAQFLMLLEVLFEGSNVHLQAALGGQLAGHFDREAEGVIEMECIQAIDDAVFHAGGNLFEFLVALLEGAGKACFLELELFKDEGAVAFELRIGFLVLVDDHLGDGGGEAFGHADLHAVAHGAADQAAENISLVRIGRGHTAVVTEDKGGCAHMVGDDAEGLGGLGVILVVPAAELSDAGKNAGEGIRVIHGFLAVEHADGALEAHAGVDVLLGQGQEGTVLLLVVLHEHVVPDFQIVSAGAGR